jgi:formylglycine-generating enzyme required for sulfatase activity/energy-coupling factor transporter ATP-binding protein EcfA2
VAPEFDVFLSYHWRDQGAVLALADQLRKQNLKVFLDRWYLTPGQPWPQELECVLASCGAVAVCVGPGEMGPWQQREKVFALERQGREPGFPVIPVLLAGADPALGFLGQNTWVDFRTGLDEPMALAILVAAIRRQPPAPELRERVQETLATLCPYKGLAYFREEDAEFFFGRQQTVDTLYSAVQRRHFVAVVGASGSGKSSVVRAGLVPRLRRDTQAPWEIVTLFPGDRPLYNLAAGLMPLLDPDLSETRRLIEIEEQAQAFAAGKLQVRSVIERILQRQSGTRRFLLIVDQWEELYTLAPETEARCFIDGLLEGAAANVFTVVLTLRGDFMGRAIGYRPLADRLQDAQVNLGPMTADELKLAIEEPARKVGVGFEAGLVERILDDVGDEPGHLPLVEFVLQRLWDDPDRQGRAMRHGAYDAMGALEGALAHTAEDVYDKLADADKQRAQRIFLQLVRPGEGAEDTRRRATLSELGEPARVIVKRLADARLLVTSTETGAIGETVEVAHEALIRHWGRFRDWLDRDREFLLWRKRLNDAREEWLRTGRDAGALLSGARLAEAQRWRKQRDDLNREELEFIACSAGLKRRRLAMTAVVGVALFLGLAFARWTDQERVSARAGFYLLLAKTGIYYLQPEMVAVPGGSFVMGSPTSEKYSQSHERPRHIVTIEPFLIGRHEVTFDEYDVFAHSIESDGGCQDGHEIPPITNDMTWGRGRRPVIYVAWNDAVCYADWLSKKTGKHYRLPSEAEWEYAARAGTATPFWWGPDIGKNRANCDGCGSEWDNKQTAPVGSFPANPFGLHDTAGNVDEWVQDCWHENENYEGAPADGTAWDSSGCSQRVVRGGSWSFEPRDLRSAYRFWDSPDNRGGYLGFRLAQDD